MCIGMAIGLQWVDLVYILMFKWIRITTNGFDQMLEGKDEVTSLFDMFLLVKRTERLSAREELEE